MTLITPTLTTMSPDGIDFVRQLEQISLQYAEQIEVEVEHFIHGGLYTRTLTIPKDIVITGALIKIPTVLIITGDVNVFTGTEVKHLVGYHVIPAGPSRKQVFKANEETKLTMLFPTLTNNVIDAEKEFTDEWMQLHTNRRTEWPEVLVQRQPPP